MAILQISQITNRKGIFENLPQLAGGELGWAVDERRLFIGNGTLAEGAPVIGNTEILTEFSDITVLSNYTYADVAVGYAAQTGPSPSTPVVRTVQAKLDDMASVRDFGAVGDGVTDDTEAINRALYQLYCRETNTAVRRTLFFPAGTYRIIESIIIPTYARLAGEGAEASVIFLDTSADISSLSAYVARYGDSLQQTGVNIGNNGAVSPTSIEITGMSFSSNQSTDIFLIDRATNCWFTNVSFRGNVSLTEIINAGVTPLADIAAIRVDSATPLDCTNITFDNCIFSNITYAFKTGDIAKGFTFSNSSFNTLYQGIVLDNSDPTGIRVVHNVFDQVYAEGLAFGASSLNASAYNLFLNVANSIGSASPTFPTITFGSNNNVSANDLFQRNEGGVYSIPNVQVTSVGAELGTIQTQFGQLYQGPGQSSALLDNESSVQAIFTVNNNNIFAFQFYYTITRTTSVRSGTITVVSGPDDSTGAMSYTDDYTENASTGITLGVSQSGSQLLVHYTSTALGVGGNITYSIKHLA